MPKRKKFVRRVWTKEEVRMLKAMAKSKAGLAKISKALKRTKDSTKKKASMMGVSLDARG